MNWRTLALRGVGFVLGLAVLSAPARADLCEYEAFTPKYLKQRILYELEAVGLNYFPASGLLDIRNDLSILKDNRLVGVLKFRSDRVLRQSTLIVEDLIGQVLLKVEESTFECHGARCRSTTFGTAVDLQENPTPYEIIFRNPGGVDHYMYNKDVSPLTYTYSVRSDLEWLTRYFRDTTMGGELQFATRIEAYRFALASDPLVRPFYPSLTFTQERGKLVVRGRVSSNAIHSLIISHALRLGFYNISPWIVIDTGYIPGEPTVLTPLECL